MHQRCENPQNSSYERYGARGIKVCKEWETFEAFYRWAIETGYTSSASPRVTIDRKDNDKGYSPENCRWVTDTQQARNRSTTIFVEYHGETKALKGWCELLGLSYVTTWRRIRVLRWSVKDAFEVKHYGRR